MLSAIIITFRELIEIFLVVGVISAALNDHKRKKSLIVVGIILGLFLAGLMAWSLGYITSLFEGYGQELVNVFMLLAAVLCIMWTLIWVNNYSMLIKKKQDEGRTNFIPLIMIISICIAREGAELILFLNGILASGVKHYEMIGGLLLGMLGGIIFGLVVYFGLIEMSKKWFFKTLNILFILLGASMSAQIANNLVSAGIITSLTQTAWDSRWLIKDESLIGKLLSGLFGYTSKPLVVEVIFYLAMVILMTFISNRRKVAKNN